MNVYVADVRWLSRYLTFRIFFLSSKLMFFTLEENVKITEALILKLVNFDEFKWVDAKCSNVRREFLFTYNNLYGFMLD